MALTIRKWVFISLLTITIVMMYIAYRPAKTPLQTENAPPLSSQPQEKASAAKAPADVFSLTFAGDNLIHDALYYQAATRIGGKGFDFGPVYQRVAFLSQGVDIAFINQETPLAGDILPLSSYPKFNSPVQVGDALAAIGYNLVNQANNHMLDMGEKGLLATLDCWNKRGIRTIGAWRTEESMKTPVLATKGNITIAFIGITEQTNALSLAKDSKMRYILSSEEKLIKEQMSLARTGGADAIILSVHWGDEGLFEPNEYQRALAVKLAEWGADIIIGHHSHTLQPMEYIKRSDGGRTLVAYSLGNFVSAQKGAPNMLGGVLQLSLTRENANAPVMAAKIEMIPVVTHYGAGLRDITIYPFSAYTPALAASHGVKGFDGRFNYSYLQQVIKKSIPAEFLSAEVKNLL